MQEGSADAPAPERLGNRQVHDPRVAAMAIADHAARHLDGIGTGDQENHSRKDAQDRESGYPIGQSWPE
jgi:hypothetical protein